MTHQLNNEQWRQFFIRCTECLGRGAAHLSLSQSFCAFTVFDRLSVDVHYWKHGLPLLDEIGERWIADGGNWGQPFRYESLAHIVIPRIFAVEILDQTGGFIEISERVQDVDNLAEALKLDGIDHRVTDLVLEIKCY